MLVKLEVVNILYQLYKHQARIISTRPGWFSQLDNYARECNGTGPQVKTRWPGNKDYQQSALSLNVENFARNYRLWTKTLFTYNTHNTTVFRGEHLKFPCIQLEFHADESCRFLQGCHIKRTIFELLYWSLVGQFSTTQTTEEEDDAAKVTNLACHTELVEG